MSKPVVRVAFFALISLVLIAATTFGVQGWLGGKSNLSGAQVHIVSGLQTNLNHDRSTVGELESLQMQGGSQPADQTGKGHGCESEGRVSPQD
jgi:hypothetical protein